MTNRHNQTFTAWVQSLNQEAAKRGLDPTFWRMSEQDVLRSPLRLIDDYEVGMTAASSLAGICFLAERQAEVNAEDTGDYTT